MAWGKLIWDQVLLLSFVENTYQQQHRKLINTTNNFSSAENYRCNSHLDTHTHTHTHLRAYTYTHTPARIHMHTHANAHTPWVMGEVPGKPVHFPRGLSLATTNHNRETVKGLFPHTFMWEWLFVWQSKILYENLIVHTASMWLLFATIQECENYSHAQQRVSWIKIRKKRLDLKTYSWSWLPVKVSERSWTLGAVLWKVQRFPNSMFKPWLNSEAIDCFCGRKLSLIETGELVSLKFKEPLWWLVWDSVVGFYASDNFHSFSCW
jgi:hypothetical protein